MKTEEKQGVRGLYRVLQFSRDLTEREIARVQAILHKQTQLSFLLASGAFDGLPLIGHHQVSNIVPLAGRNVLARRLANDTTYTGIITHGALGSAATSFTNNSTQLGTEVFRKAPSGQSVDGNIAYIDWFIASGDVANQTFQEFGAVIDGTGSANTGQLFSAVATGGWVKTGAMFISLSVRFE